MCESPPPCFLDRTSGQWGSSHDGQGWWQMQCCLVLWWPCYSSSYHPLFFLSMTAVKCRLLDRLLNICVCNACILVCFCILSVHTGRVTDEWELNWIEYTCQVQTYRLRSTLFLRMGLNYMPSYIIKWPQPRLIVSDPFLFVCASLFRWNNMYPVLLKQDSTAYWPRRILCCGNDPSLVQVNL